MRLLTRKLLVAILVVGGILAAFGIYMSTHPMVQEATGSVAIVAPEEEDTLVIPEEAHVPGNYTIPSQIMYRGNTYSVLKDLNFVGPVTPLCPYCGSNSTAQAGSSSQRKYWFYYYQCHTCHRKFATYASR